MTRSESLHPEVRSFLESAESGPRIETLTPLEARVLRNQRMRTLAGDPDPLERVEDILIPGPAGDIPARLYAPERISSRSALVYFHGGGFVVGNLDTHDAVCRAIAREAAAAVVAVDYRLAPEHPFPAAVEDAWTATLWVAANASGLGVDPSHISVGGDSAGGNLATVVALRSRDAGAPALAAQVLIYPITDFSSFDTGSYTLFAEGYGLTRAAMQWFAGHYLPNGSRYNPEASPLLHGSLTGLPPALIITAECDPLRDEAETYADSLRRAGIPVTLSRHAGTIHGFMAMRGVLSGGRRAIGEVAAFLRASVH